MAHIFVPDGVRVVIQATGPDLQLFMNTLHVQVPGGGPPAFADCQNIANAVLGWYNGQYRQMFPAVVVGRQIVATSMASAPGPQASVGGMLAGLRTGTELSANISLCVKLATHLSGKRHRGRFYTFPPVTTDLAAPNSFTPAYVTAILGVLGNLGAALTAAGYTWVVGSLTDARLYPITSVIAVDSVVDSQRRRLPLRGR